MDADRPGPTVGPGRICPNSDREENVEASISGLASGLQWDQIVDDLMALERRPLTQIESRIADEQRRSAAWDEVRGILQSLESASAALHTASSDAFHSYSVALAGFSETVGSPIGATADALARPGRHTVRVHARAEAEMVGGSLHASRTEALGLSGEFLVNGRAVQVGAGDSLDDIATRIERVNIGSARSGAGAAVSGTGSGFRLILTASEPGAAGIRLADPDGILEALGLHDGSRQLRERTPDGFLGASFADATTAVASLLGLSGATGIGAGTIELGSGPTRFAVSLDLATQSLDEVAAAIRDAAMTAGSGVTAAVVDDGAGGHRLEVSGTNGFVDAGGVLELLGAVEGGRAAVAQEVQGGALVIDGAATPAVAGTLLTALRGAGGGPGIMVGDTLTLRGTRGDGSHFDVEHTVGASDDLQTLLDRLNGAEGFDGTATAAVVDGRITVTDAQAGPSRLGLEILAGNEGGGTFDPGDFTLTREGRRREVVAGSDALIEVNGSFLERSTNRIGDAIEGVTLDLLTTDPGTEVEITIERDTEAAATAIEAFVEAYNRFTRFVDAGVGESGAARPPLAGDAVLRSMRTALQGAMQVQLLDELASGTARLGDIGITVQRDRTFAVDTAVLGQALADDFEGVARLFRGEGSTTSSGLTFLGGGAGAAQGTHAVVITAEATTAAVTSSGALPFYVDDGVPDRLILTDSGSGSAYAIDLADGDSLTAIVDRLNTELATARAREVTAGRVVYADAGATTVADASTRLADLHNDDGSPAGFVAGTVVSFSGTRRGGNPFVGTFTVSDPATQTLGQLRSALSQQLGSGVQVRIVDGALVVRESRAGASDLAVTIGTDIPGNTAVFGTFTATAEGRDASGLRAAEVGGEIEIRASGPGSAHGFTLAFEAGGADGTGGLGLLAGTHVGSDVQGTIGGHAATGAGATLTGSSGTPVAGLAIGTAGAGVGEVGSVTFGRGVASSMKEVLAALLGSGSGSVSSVQEGIGRAVDRLEGQMDRWETRLASRREVLMRKFTALEMALAQAQSQSAWLVQQFATLSAGSGQGFG